MSHNLNVALKPLQPDDRELFIRDNQWSFKYGALLEFGRRDDHFEEDGEIISRQTIEQTIDSGIAYRIWLDGKIVGGAVIKTQDNRGWLELLFVDPEEHSKGIGYAAWRAIEAMHPQIEIWETCTPYFEKRNIHFYVNRCGFHIVEFYNSHHRDPNESSDNSALQDDCEMFRFEKIMRQIQG